MKKSDEILAELLRVFPGEERVLLRLEEKDIVEYLILSSQEWATRESILRAFKEGRFEEIKSAQEKAARLFAFGMKYQQCLLSEKKQKK